MDKSWQSVRPGKKEKIYTLSPLWFAALYTVEHCRKEHSLKKHFANENISKMYRSIMPLCKLIGHFAKSNCSSVIEKPDSRVSL